MKFKLLFICLYCNLLGKAQHFKAGVLQGIGWDANQANDSLFLATQHLYTQLQAGYHYGKLGGIMHITYGRQAGTNNNKDERFPEFGPVAFFDSVVGSTVQTIQTTLGAELCLPIIKNKFQTSIYSTYGISYASSDSFKILTNALPVYSTAVDNTKSITGSFQSGVALNYSIAPKIQMRWQNEWNMYKLPFTNFDERKAISVTNDNQTKNVFITSLGITYKF
jgi:hypothetical protein